MALKDLLDKWSTVARPWEQGTEPLEIREAILYDVASQVIAAGAGKRIFPYGRVKVYLLVDGPEERARFEAAVEQAWNLDEALCERLLERGAEPPKGFGAEVVIVEEGGEEFAGRRYRLAYERAPGPAADAPPPARPALELAVVRGKAAQESYRFTAERILLGRLDEVLDEAGRVKRRNDVVFLDEADEINRTVSREHARLSWDEESKSFWLRAEAQGVRIFRGGDPIEVSRHDRRGVRVLDGDEIYLGRACLKVSLAEG